MIVAVIRRSLVPLCLLGWLAVLETRGAAATDPALAGYANYQTLAQQVAQLARSEWVTQSSLGRTLGGREVFLLSIGTGRKDHKPALLVVGNVEAAHLVGSEMAMRIARTLAEKAAADPATRKLLDRFTVYVIPRPQPGRQREMLGAAAARAVR